MARFRTGNQATITLAGDLTTGLTTAFTAAIVSIDPGEMTLGERDVSTLLDDEFARVEPQDLVATPEITSVIRFLPTESLPAIEDKTVATVTITFPKQSTVATATSRATFAGNGYFSRVKLPSLSNNETMDAEIGLKFTGESLAFTKES